MSDLTSVLNDAGKSNSAAAEKLLGIVYEELRSLARSKMARERPGTLQPTALVNEAWIRLNRGRTSAWENRRHFFGAAAEAMRRILVERARRRYRFAEELSDDESRLICEPPAAEILAVHDALDQLAAVDAEAAELVKLRYFVGMSMPEAAEAIGQSLRQTERVWTFARAWLRRALSVKDYS
jgi:RNA polymerase sigma factor (TIGR02999 family)